MRRKWRKIISWTVVAIITMFIMDDEFHLHAPEIYFFFGALFSLIMYSTLDNL